MKLAVLKLGGRITGNATSGPTGETLTAIQMLQNDGQNLVTYFTKLLKTDTLIDKAIPVDIENSTPYYNFNKAYDALVVINGNINFFGGAEVRLDLLNLTIINNWKGPIFYLLFDPDLTLKQYWKNVDKKQNNPKYKWKNKYRQEDIEIIRKDIICISQPYNIEATKKLLAKTKIQYKDVIHFPLYKMPLITQERLPINHNRSVDLIYGGTFRTGRREQKLVKYYFDYPESINVEIFGKIKLSQFKAKNIKGINYPKFTGMIRYDEFLNKMSNGLSTVIIGDKWYEGNNYAQRIYESILSNVVTFIDIDMDPKKQIYKDNDILKEFLYVKNKNDVIERIMFLKSNVGHIETILNEQISAVYINKKEYLNQLNNIIKDNI